MEQENNKKKIIIPIIIIAIILVLLSIAYIIYTKVLPKNNKPNTDNSNEPTITENGEIEEEITEDGLAKKGEYIYFYDSNGKTVGKFLCNHSRCYSASINDNPQHSYYYVKKDTVLVFACDTTDDNNEYCFMPYYGNFEESAETNSVYFHNLNTGKDVVQTNVKSLEHLTKDDGSMSYLIIENNDGTYSLIKTDGNLIRKYDKDALMLTCYEGCMVDPEGYSIENDSIAIKKNGKYGLTKISTGDIIIDYTFDEIELAVKGSNNLYKNNKYFVGTKDNIKNIYLTSDGTQITKNGYEKISFLGENSILVYSNKTFSIVDYEENKIIEKDITVSKLDAWEPKMPDGYNVSLENDIVTISICESFYDNINTVYTYNLKTKELIKKDK